MSFHVVFSACAVSPACRVCYARTRHSVGNDKFNKTLNGEPVLLHDGRSVWKGRSGTHLWNMFGRGLAGMAGALSKGSPAPCCLKTLVGLFERLLWDVPNVARNSAETSTKTGRNCGPFWFFLWVGLKSDPQAWCVLTPSGKSPRRSSRIQRPWFPCLFPALRLRRCPGRRRSRGRPG